MMRHSTATTRPCRDDATFPGCRLKTNQTADQGQKNNMKTTISIFQRYGLIANLLFWAGVSSAQAQTNTGLNLQLYAGLSITGVVGQVYQVQYADEMSDSATWYALMHFPLKWNPHQWVDTTGPATRRRFYRAVVVAVPTNVIPATNMVFIAPGKFLMGSPTNEPARFNDENPQRLVTLSRGYWIGKHEVTQGEFLEVMGYNPSFHNGVQDLPTPGTDYGTDLSRPVEQVSWNEAVAYCQALTAREQNEGQLPPGFQYRLPTEAEWEYACRAGTTTPYHYGSALRSGMANFDGRFEYPPCSATTNHCENVAGTFLKRTTPVGSYTPNAWGLYDMHGNVSEFCQDYANWYPAGPVTDPQGPASGTVRIVRGGVWGIPAHFLRSAHRDWLNPTVQHYYFGFRVVLGPTF